MFPKSLHTTFYSDSIKNCPISSGRCQQIPLIIPLGKILHTYFKLTLQYCPALVINSWFFCFCDLRGNQYIFLFRNIRDLIKFSPRAPSPYLPINNQDLIDAFSWILCSSKVNIERKRLVRTLQKTYHRSRVDYLERAERLVSDAVLILNLSL